MLLRNKRKFKNQNSNLKTKPVSAPWRRFLIYACTRCGHFCRTLHVAMQVGLYHTSALRWPWRIVSTDSPATMRGCLGIVPKGEFPRYSSTFALRLWQILVPHLRDGTSFPRQSFALQNFDKGTTLLHGTPPCRLRISSKSERFKFDAGSARGVSRKASRRRCGYGSRP